MTIQAARGGRDGARRRGVAGWGAWLIGAVLIASCGGSAKEGVDVGGETHFLVTCEEGCGSGLTCIDDVCTRPCEPGYSSCSELASEAACLSAPSDAAPRQPFSGVCDVQCDADADCAALGSRYSCISGACRAQPESGQTALASRRQALVQAVDTEVCVTSLRWVGGDRPSAEMRPGSDCVGCHRDTGARPLLLGGTVYGTGGLVTEPQPLDDCFGLEGVEVMIVDADGRELSLRTNRAGNFYLEGPESELALPYATFLRWRDFEGSEVTTPMVTQPVYGGCARCHFNGDRAAREPVPEFFNIFPEDSEYINPQGVIWTPGFYPTAP